MERLTERDAYWIGEEFWVSAREPDEAEIDEVYEKLKEYEDLEEQGLLLRLPCKVGTIVYVIVAKCNGDYYNCHHYCEECRDFDKYICSLSFYAELIDDFGKTVFLTKAEAEEALAKMKGENNE